MSQKETLLLVDDESNVLKSLKRLLIDTDYKVLSATSGEEGLKKLEEVEIQVVISDYRMPEMNGVEFLRKVKEKYPDSVRIVLSGYADIAAIVEAINEGEIYRFIAKPWNDHDLITTIYNSFEKYRLQQENTRLYAEIILKCKELEELTKSLEDKVAERTRTLEMKNKALTVAQNILNSLPVGVIGADSSGLVVYSNQILGNYIDASHLYPGANVMDTENDKVCEILKQVIEGKEPKCSPLGENSNIYLICTLLPNQEGVIGAIAYFDANAWITNIFNSKQKQGV